VQVPRLVDPRWQTLTGKVALTHARGYREILVPLMDGLEQGLTTGHDAEAMDCLVTLNLELGEKLEWSTLPQFDEFMADPDRSLRL
jgi:hypothetical protein